MPSPHARTPVLALAARAALDLLLPVECAGCGDLAGPLCGDCADDLPRWGALARRPGALPGLPAVVAAGPYDGVLRAALLAHKDGATALARPLGGALAGAVLAGVVLPGGPGGSRAAGAARRAAVPGGTARRPRAVAGGPRAPVVLVPAPSSPRAVRERGQDHALRLAQAAARELRRRGVRARAVRALRQCRAVDDQGSLTAGARAANLRGAVGLRRPVARLRAACQGGAFVVLVDDVCASGATLAECARVLTRAGHRPSVAAVAAATVLRSGPVEAAPVRRRGEGPLPPLPRTVPGD